MPPRKFVRRVPERPEWEGKGTLIVRVRDLSLVKDADVWKEMSKVTSQSHHRDVICRQDVTVELTDVSTQAELISGNAIRDIGFSTGGGGSRGRRVAPKKAPALPGRAPRVPRPVASSSAFTNRTWKGDKEVTKSAATTMREKADPGKAEAKLKAEAKANLKAEAEAKWKAPASNKKRKRRNNLKASSTASTTVPTPTPRPTQQPPVQQQRSLPRYHLSEVDHRLAPLSVPGRAPALRVQQQHPKNLHPPPASRGSANSTGPSTGAMPKNISRREEMKVLTGRAMRAGVRGHDDGSGPGRVFLTFFYLTTFSHFT